MSRIRGLAIVVVGVSALACSGMDDLMTDAAPPPAPVEAAPASDPAPSAAPTSGGGNVAACTKYIEKYNSLECMGGVKLDAATMCSPSMDQMPCDISKYWNCMAENTKCNGAIPDMSGLQGCGSPVCM
jgi:hypothetical protein